MAREKRDHDAGTCSVTLPLLPPHTHTQIGRLADRHTQLQPHSIVAIAREIDFLNANALHMS